MTAPTQTTRERLGLLDRLSVAVSDGIGPNMRRFLRFRGTVVGEPIELQTLKVPGRYQENRCAYSTDHAEIVRLLESADAWKAQGVYLIMNAIDPAVATRAAPGQWNVMNKNESTTDSEIVERRSLFVDVDSRRPKGTSATDAQVGAALEVAERIYHRFAALLSGTSALGLGHSGNGAAVMVALDGIANDEAVTSTIKGILSALSETYSAEMVEIDASVCDAKRLCPAWGTTKRKGAAGVPDRPHRRTAFICDDVVQRVGVDALARILASLCQYLNEEQRAAVDRAMGRRPSAPSSAAPRPVSGDSPYLRANAVSVADVCARLGLLSGESVRCPGCGTVGDSSVAIVGNGLKCLHARCADKGAPGRPGFRSVVDIVCEARGVRHVEAVNLLGDWFGFTPAWPQRAPAPQAHQNGTLSDEDIERDAIRDETPAPDASDEAPTAPATAPGFQFLTLDELCAPLEPVNYLIEVLDMCPGRPMQIAGTGFAGKTICAQSMVMSIIAGRPVWGSLSCRQGPAVHLDYEMGRRATLRRYRRLCVGAGISWEAQVAPWLRLAPLPRLYLNTRGVEDYLKRATEGATIALIDSLRRALPGEEENDSAITEYIDALPRVSEATGCVFVFLHHSTTKSKSLEGQDSRGAGRGTSAIFDSSGAVLSMVGKRGQPVLVTQTKAPERGTACEDFLLHIEDVEVDGDPKAGVRVRYEVCVVPAQDAAAAPLETDCARVVEYIRSENEQGRAVAGKDAIASGISMRRSNVAAAVDTLIARGVIEDRPERGRTRFWVLS